MSTTINSGTITGPVTLAGGDYLTNTTGGDRARRPDTPCEPFDPPGTAQGVGGDEP
jgi:hypothetical protein